MKLKFAISLVLTLTLGQQLSEKCFGYQSQNVVIFSESFLENEELKTAYPLLC